MTGTQGTARLGRVELGGFRLRQVLGEGSFGMAYLAEQLGTDRHAVVKIAHPHLMSGPVGAITRQRFEAEVRAVSRVDHPSLMRLYTAGTTSDGLPALATEYVPGRTLGDVLDEGMPRTDVQTCFEQIAEGLQALHAHGIIHRDLSPENVMVDRSPAGLRAKIIDFGVARVPSGASSGMHALGTPRYMAPEQIRGEASTASDVYALGVLLYFALAGQEYLAELSSAYDIMAYVNAAHDVLPSGPFAASVTPQEDALVRALLAHDASRRPTASGFLERWRDLHAAPDKRALVVDDDDTSSADVAEALRARGYRVQITADARRASRASPGDYDLVAVSAHLRSVDSLRLVQHLEEYLPDQVVWVTGHEFGIGWQAVRRARCLRPDELRGSTPPPSRAATPLSRTRRTDPRDVLTPVPTPRSPSHTPAPSSVRASRRGAAVTSERAMEFIGGGAELVAALREGAQHDDVATVVSTADALVVLARDAGVSDVWSLTRTLCALAREGELAAGQLDTFVHEIDTVYRSAARRLLAGDDQETRA